MSLPTLNSKPKSIDFVDNPICFELTGANVFSTVGVQAENYLVKGAANTTDGDSIGIAFLDYDFTFTFKTSPDDSGFQLYAGKTVNDTIDELQYNYYLTKHFDITLHGSDNIKFKAKEVGSQYQITFDLSNITAYTNGGSTIGVDPIKNENYKLFIQLLVSSHGADSFEELFTTFLDPDEDDKVYFYPGCILKNAFTSAPLPGFNSTTIETWLPAMLDYYIRYSEYYGSDPTIKKLVEHKAISLINGKLHNDKWPTHNFLTDLATSKIFLTNKPVSQDTWDFAHQYLFFMNYIESSYDMTAYFDITYDDGTTDTQQVSLTALATSMEHIYCIPVGMDQVDLLSQSPSKTIAFYKVYLMHDTSRISEERYFYRIPQPMNSLQILFKNNYGCLDSLLCYNAKVQFKHDSVFVEKLLTVYYTMKEGNNSSMLKEQFLTISTNTGYLSAEEIYQLAELFENNTAYLVGATKYIKIELVSNSFTLIDTKNNMQNFEIRFRLSVSGSASLTEIL